MSYQLTALCRWLFIITSPNQDHLGTPRRCLLIFRRVVSAKHGLDLHRLHGGFLRQEQAELAQRNHMDVLLRGWHGIDHIERVTLFVRGKSKE